MTEQEYQEFLDAVGRRQLRLGLERFGPGGSDVFRHDLERLIRTHRFAQVVGERHDDVALYASLGKELEWNDAQRMFAALEQMGVVEALDDHRELIFGSLTKQAIPIEDAGFLRAAGIQEAEEELVILAHQGRYLVRGADFRAADTLNQASLRLSQVARELRDTPSQNAATEARPKPKKYFNGIAKILSGAILGGGNLLIGIGAIPASGGAALAGVIASSAAAVTAVGQGIGDLRGE